MELWESILIGVVVFFIVDLQVLDLLYEVLLKKVQLGERELLCVPTFVLVQQVLLDYGETLDCDLRTKVDTLSKQINVRLDGCSQLVRAHCFQFLYHGKIHIFEQS